MRARPSRLMAPDDGRSSPESRLSSVVLPHPEGPTTATNSPREISSERGLRTSTAPKERETFSRRSSLSLIAPTHTGNPRELDEEAVDDYADHSDDRHPDDEQVHPQPVARVPDGEAQPVPAGDHLGGDDDDPGHPGCDAQ